MYTVKTKEEFVQELSGLDECLKNIKLSSIEIKKSARKIRYVFICDQAVSPELKNQILNKCELITPKEYTSMEIEVKKIVSEEELINKEIYKFVTTNFPSVAIFFKDTDIKSAKYDNLIKYVLRLTEDAAIYFNKNNTVKTLNEYLSKQFCSDFAGSIEIKPAEETPDLSSASVYKGEIEKIEYRTVKVENVELIDDLSIGDTAVYIEDYRHLGEHVICGNVVSIREKLSKNGKPYFVIYIDDTTGRTSGIYFSRKTTLEKIRLIKEGDAIIARVSVTRNDKGDISTTFNKINKCTFPKDFVKKDRYKKPTPKEYRLIFPEKASTVSVASVFDDTSVPEIIKDKVYVVFDLETTGTEVMNCGITEIGAVKIVEGKIVEQFTTLVKPDYPISAKITELTGIDEEMVKDSPKIEEVIPDFMKFIEGATLVGHNLIDFDIKFIKRFAGASDYEVKNPLEDTLLLARKYLPELSNHKLNEVAEHFDIVFRHHRALSDAYATAEAFIKIMKIKENSKK